MQLELRYRRVKDRYLPGRMVPAFIHNGKHYYLVNVEVFQDGVIYCVKPMDLTEFKEEVWRGWIVSQLPEGASISIRPGLSVIASPAENEVANEEFIKEVDDIIQELNGKETSIQYCRRCLSEYMTNQSHEAKRRLLEAYERVPKHRRLFIGGMKDKDLRVREALGLDMTPE